MRSTVRMCSLNRVCDFEVQIIACYYAATGRRANICVCGMAITFNRLDTKLVAWLPILLVVG